MTEIFTVIHNLFTKSPEIAIFLSLALGFWVGKFRLGSFQLGGVAGSLLVAVCLSQFGASGDATVKNILFALFIYAVGYDSGPKFFKSLGKQSLREIALAATVAIAGLITVVVLAKLFSLDKGLAAGIAAGGLTQSAIIGVAGDALSKLNLDPEILKTLQSNVAVGYAVTYVFGSFGAIIVCVNILPKFMGKSIRDDAIAAEVESAGGLSLLEPGQELAIAHLVGRIYQINGNPFPTVEALEKATKESPVTVEQIKRGNSLLTVAPDTKLEDGDLLLIVGRRDLVLELEAHIGKEVPSVPGMELIMQKREVIANNKNYIGKTVGELKSTIDENLRHGVFVLSLLQDGKPTLVTADTILMEGDLITFYGAEQDVNRIASEIGYIVVPSDKTDFVFMGLGLVVGLLIGMISVKLAGLPITLGSGGGALLAGLAFGWYQQKHRNIGNLPSGASQLLKDLGLAGFVVVVGLDSGLQAVATIQSHGFTIFLIGVAVTIIPLLIGMVVARYLFGYKNTALLAGALSGARSANPAFGEILNEAGNSIPTVPFAITYALANVFLTLLDPLIVALV